MSLPIDLYTRQQSRDIDRCAIEEHQQEDLMAQAGACAWQFLCQYWPDCNEIVVFTGKGNNGGDGYVVARHAQSAGKRVQVYSVVEPTQLQGEAQQAYLAALQAGVTVTAITEVSTLTWARTALVVDALLGTGLTGQVAEPYHAIIESINQTECDVLALDIPSGLDADTGMVLGVAVEALVTVSFITLKQGCFLQAGPDYCGSIEFAPLQLPAEVMQAVTPSMQRLVYEQCFPILPSRHRLAHKGDFGHVVLIGGDHGMLGAVVLAARAALRAGAGKVTVATRASHCVAISSCYPEIMTVALEKETELAPAVAAATAVVIGPGLDRGCWGEHIWQTLMALQHTASLVVDADALYFLANSQVKRHDWVLTPHPGEAATLLQCNSQQIQSDRGAAVSKLQYDYGGVVVLKGASSLVKGADPVISLCELGNPGMSAPGMGDLLTGVIAALVAQQLSLAHAAHKGVMLHAMAGDMAAHNGERGMQASDLLPYLYELVNTG